MIVFALIYGDKMAVSTSAECTLAPKNLQSLGFAQHGFGASVHTPFILLNYPDTLL